MPKTKISEFSSTPANNTDIDSINIAENCPPSGINDAIRELMSQLKDWQSGTSNDPMVIGSSGSLTLNQGTANGVTYLNGSKVVTSGSALTFDGTSLGVGTASPASKLTIGGSGANRISFGAPAGTQFVGYDGTTDILQIASYNDIRFQVNAYNEGMRLTSTGLGIGTSSPSFKLDLNGIGAVRAGNAIRYYRTDNAIYTELYDAGSSGFTLNNANGNGFRFQSAGSTQATLDSSGNLGLGVTDPATYGGVFVARSTSGANFSVRTLAGIGGSGTGVGLDALANSAGSVVDIGIRGSTIQFRNSGSEAARIDSSGNFQIGTTGVNARLAVEGTTGLVETVNIQHNGSYSAMQVRVKTTGFTDNVILASTDIGATSAFTFLKCSAGGAEQLKILGNGNVQNINNSYGAISDAKLKENVVDTSPKLADLMQVKVRNYNLIGSTTKQLGVIAQELESVFPAMVEETVDQDAEGNDLGTTTKSVKYSVFVPMLLKAIQEQQAIIESLKARLDAANL